MGTYSTWGNFYIPAVGEVGWAALVDAWSEALGIQTSQITTLRGHCAGDGIADDTDGFYEALAEIQWYEIGPGFPAPGGWPVNQTFSGLKAAPEEQYGGIGGILLCPPGVYNISRCLNPDFRGGTENGHAGHKNILIVGAGSYATTFRWTGDDNVPMMLLGGNGIDITDLDSQLGSVSIGAGASDGTTFISDIGFDGGTARTPGATYLDACEHAGDGLVLVETSNITVQRLAFGNLRRHGIYSIPDPLSGNDYGSIGLTVRDCILSGYLGGRTYGKGIWAKDPHALRILNNESGGACLRGNLKVGGGGGNGHLIQGNSWEGVGQISGADWGPGGADMVNFPNSYGGVDPNGDPMFPAAWDTDSLGNHSVHLSVNSDVNYYNNAHEDTISSTDPLVPGNADIRLLFIEDTPSVHVMGNDMRVNSDYAIEVYGNADDIHIKDNYAVSGYLGSVDTRSSSLAHPHIFESGNGFFSINASESTQNKIKHGPQATWYGYSPKLIVGDYMVAKALNSNAGVLSSNLTHIRSTLDVRGQIVTDKGLTTAIVAARAPANGDFENALDGTVAFRGKIAAPTGLSSTAYGAALADPAVPSSIDNDRYWYYVVYVTAAGTTDTDQVVNCTVTDHTVNGTIIVTVPVGPPGTTGRQIWRRSDITYPLTYHLITTIANNTTTTYTDSATDASISGASTAIPVTNTSDTVNRIYGRSGGSWRFADLSSTTHLTGTTTWNPGSLATGATESKTVTVTGAALGDTVALGFTIAVPAGMLLTGSVTATDTVTATLYNVAAANPTDLGSGTLRADVWQH